MPVPSRRLAVAGVIAAAVIALPAAAFASGSDIVRQASAVRGGEQLRAGG